MAEKRDKPMHSEPSTCKICHGPIPEKRDTHGPFCSDRCRLQDLSKWFGESYRIAGTPATRTTEPDDEDEQ